MPDFTKRSDDIEIMDNLACSGEVVHQTLRELETINHWLGGNKVTIDGLRELVKEKGPTRVLTIADLGCGGGDMLRLMRQWSEKKAMAFDLTGIDANPFIIAFARHHTPQACNIRFEVVDIFSDSFKAQTFDIVTGTLFFHHFTGEQLIAFFSQLKHQAHVGFIVNDIHRHWFAYYSIRWLTKLFSRSAMVKYDAPLSVLRAFTRKELVDILHLAGISRYTLRWRWAFRWQLIVRTY